MICHYPDMGSAFDWLCFTRNLSQRRGSTVSYFGIVSSLSSSESCDLEATSMLISSDWPVVVLSSDFSAVSGLFSLGAVLIM